MAGGLQALQAAQHFRQHPAADGDDQAGLLGDRDEAIRRHEFPVGALPAEQGFGADDLAGVEVDLRLVDDGQFAALEGGAQVVQQQGVLACRVADFR